MGTNISRRRVIKAAAAVTGAVAAPMVLRRLAWAQGKQIEIGIWSGAQGEFVKKQVIPKFEADFGCKVLAEEGFTLQQISKLRATKANPKYTVMFVDELAIDICKREDLIAKIPTDKLPNLAKLYPRFIYEDGYGTGIGSSTGGLFYNTSITPPKSFAELWDLRFKGQIKLNGPKNTPSVHFLIATASVVTGKPFKEAQYLVDQAWTKLAELKPNIQNLYDSAVEAANQVAQGQAMIGGIESSKYVYPYTRQGAPVTMAYMQEGTFAAPNCQILAKNGPNMDLGLAFMDRMLAPEVQKPLSEFALMAPAVSGIEFSKEFLEYVPYPDSKMDALKLFSPDWTHVNQQRSGWIEKMNQIFSA